MASEEDKKFNAVLGGYLTSDLRSRAERLHCPEPDVLAAYHERSLSLDELNSWKSHVAGCVRCQQILAHLENTEHLEVEVASGEKVLVMNEPAIFNERSPIAKDQLASAAVARPAQRIRPGSIMQGRQRKTHWRWFVPAGAIAAGLLVWIALHESKPAGVLQPKP